jgi:paraquat-inducible protein A
MVRIEFGEAKPDTIFSGILRLYNTGFVLIAVLIFIASIVVPILKISGLMYLLHGVQTGRIKRTAHRIWSYRIIRVIGRWSMLDMFVMSVLLASVQFGNLANVDPGPAASFFTMVVVLTMLAAETFDSRLLWTAESAESRQ